MKTYKITEEQIEELQYYLNNNSLNSAKNLLKQLPELKEKEVKKQ